MNIASIARFATMRTASAAPCMALIATLDVVGTTSDDAHARLSAAFAPLGESDARDLADLVLSFGGGVAYSDSVNDVFTLRAVIDALAGDALDGTGVDLTLASDGMMLASTAR